MDRNISLIPSTTLLIMSLSARRAWIEMRKITITVDEGTSLSARRAWIEILRSHKKAAKIWGSLSARRAWIEIGIQHRVGEFQGVALRKESVDRNSMYVTRLPRVQGRSPQGERG